MSQTAVLPRSLIWLCCLAVMMFNVLILAQTSNDAAPSLLIEHTEGHAVDHIAFWAAGRLANQGAAATAYDPAVLTAVQSDGLGYPYIGEMLWFYPPLAQIMAQPFALLDPFWSLAIWNVVGLGALLIVVWRIVPDPLALAAAGSAGPVFAVLFNGQIGLYIAAIAGLCLFGLMRDLEGRSRGGGTGAWLALLLLKPQTVFAIPVALAASGRWRPLFIAVAVGLGIIAASLVVQGVGGWIAFFQTLTGTADYFLTGRNAAAFWPKYTTLYGAARDLGAGFWPAVIGQGLLMAGALAAAVAALRSDRAPAPAVAAIIAYACVVTAPRLYGYDLPLLVIGGAFQARAAMRLGWAPGEAAVLMLGFAAAELAFLGGPHLAALAGPLLLAFAFWRYCYSASARGRA